MTIGRKIIAAFKVKEKQAAAAAATETRVTITQKDWDKIDAILGNDQIRPRLFDAGYIIVRR
jgi:hypothetical protein